MKLIFDVVSGQAKYGSLEELEPGSVRSAAPKHQLPHNIPGYRKDGTDRGAMIAAFSKHFPGLTAKELGKLFDKYRVTGRIDVQWNAKIGCYDILFESRDG